MKHLHNYQIVKNTPEAIVEVCVECKKRLITRKTKAGRVDNQKYLDEHARDTAQPCGKTAKIFERYYGDYKDRIKPPK